MKMKANICLQKWKKCVFIIHYAQCALALISTSVKWQCWNDFLNCWKWKWAESFWTVSVETKLQAAGFFFLNCTTFINHQPRVCTILCFLASASNVPYLTKLSGYVVSNVSLQMHKKQTFSTNSLLILMLIYVKHRQSYESWLVLYKTLLFLF